MGSHRALVALTLLLGLASLAPKCGLPSVIANVTPGPGDVISTFSFTVEIELGANANPATLSATLNGVPIALTGGPTLFTATVNPGPPLLDDNKLRVFANRTDGVLFRRTIPFKYLPPKARARQITDPADLIEGPLAHGRVGDWLLENTEARYVVQDAPVRDLHSIGQFGGNLIDAELVVNGVRQGNDNFLEIQPLLNVETVSNAETVEIVNDGQDGTAAIIRACGPDDIIDYINPSSIVADLGFALPPGVDDVDQPVEACTEYRLEPLVPQVEVETEVFNLSAAQVGLYVGDYLNGAGEVDQWSPPTAGVGEIAITVPSSIGQSFFGFGEGSGVDYAYVPIELPGAPFPTSSFTTSGVTASLTSHSIPLVLALGFPPNFFVPAGGSNSYTRYFAVGDGSPSNFMDLFTSVTAATTGTVSGCVTVGGVPAPGARVAVGPVSGTTIKPLTTLFIAGDDGCYSGEVPVGSYGMAAAREGAPYEGGGSAPLVRNVTVVAGVNPAQDFALPATGHVRVEVVDGSGSPVPARVSVVGFDPSPEPRIFTNALSVNDVTTGLFHDITKDGLPFGLTRIAYAGADGIAEFDLEPGTYQIYVSRGTEWSLFSAPLNVAAGPTTVVNAAIAPVLDTTGFFSSDYHVHMLNSPDSRISFRRRVMSFAGEGVDNIIATDHDAHTDLDPTIASLGLTGWVSSTVGEEITTFDYGHYNAYPLLVDPTRAQSFGSTDWGRAAPVGEDFPSLGAYGLTPAEIEAAAVASTAGSGLETVVQINHIDSHFEPLRIDTSLEPPQSFADPAVFRLDPTTPNLFHAFGALELWNGNNNGDQSNFLDERIGIWMNLLNQGIVATAISDTDTHTFNNLVTSGARTWTPAINGGETPPTIDDNDIGLAVKAGKAVGGQGVYAQAKLVAASTAQQASFAPGDPTLVSTTDGAVDLVIDVQAPAWAAYDTIEIYTNASTLATGANAGTDVLFTALPSQTLVAGTDFAVTPVVVDPGVPGATRQETHVTVPLTGLTTDTWVVVIVKGTAGTSPPMFPVFASNLTSGDNPDLASLVTNTPTESGVRALAVTNALFVDVDGNATFDPPGVSEVPGP